MEASLGKKIFEEVNDRSENLKDEGDNPFQERFFFLPLKRICLLFHDRKNERKDNIRFPLTRKFQLPLVISWFQITGDGLSFYLFNEAVVFIR